MKDWMPGVGAVCALCCIFRRERAPRFRRYFSQYQSVSRSHGARSLALLPVIAVVIHTNVTIGNTPYKYCHSLVRELYELSPGSLADRN
jgi:hypothetical protein